MSTGTYVVPKEWLENDNTCLVPFVTESCLVKLLMSVSDVTGPKMPQARLHTLLDLMWMVMDPQEVENTFENILISLLTAYRYFRF